MIKSSIIDSIGASICTSPLKSNMCSISTLHSHMEWIPTYCLSHCWLCCFFHGLLTKPSLLPYIPSAPPPWFSPPLLLSYLLGTAITLPFSPPAECFLISLHFTNLQQHLDASYFYVSTKPPCEVGHIHPAYSSHAARRTTQIPVFYNTASVHSNAVSVDRKVEKQVSICENTIHTINAILRNIISTWTECAFYIQYSLCRNCGLSFFFYVFCCSVLCGLQTPCGSWQALEGRRIQEMMWHVHPPHSDCPTEVAYFIN